MAPLCSEPLCQLTAGDTVEELFNTANIAIHGITAEAVRNSPTLPDCYLDLMEILSGSILVTYTDFDREALAGAAENMASHPLRQRGSTPLR
jgi:DNA polymerase III epsilon subunit-like protein